MRLVLVSFSFFLPSFLPFLFILFYFISFHFIFIFIVIFIFLFFYLFLFIFFFFGGGGLTQSLSWSAASIPCMPLQLQQAIRQVRQVRVFVLV